MNVTNTKKATIIIPTYNEAGNIAGLLEDILRVICDIDNYEISVLVVDDNSPDGTAEVVEKLSADRVFLLKRRFKEGLGNAYRDGFRYAIDELDADIVFEMDGDFSHDPGYIPMFLKEIDEGYDFVIGSRHVEGGSIPTWGVHRKIISSVGNLLAKKVLDMGEVTDCTSGYRAVKVSLLQRMDLDDINVKGYAFQLSLLYSAKRNGAKIKELPIVFHKRRAGKSKISLMDISEFIAEITRLRLRD